MLGNDSQVPSHFLVWAMQQSGGTSFTSLLSSMHRDPTIHEPFAGRRARTEYADQMAALGEGLWPDEFSSLNFKHCYEYASAEFNHHLMKETICRGYCPILLERDDELTRIESLALARLTGIYGQSGRDDVYSAVASSKTILPPIDIDWARKHLRRCLRRKDEIKAMIKEYGGHYVRFEKLFTADPEERSAKWQSVVNTLKATGLPLEKNPKYTSNRDKYLFQKEQNSSEISEHVPNIGEFRSAVAEILNAHRASAFARPLLREATSRRIFVDLGANIGRVSEKALSEEFFDVAWLFEPNPELAEKLRKRFEGKPVEIIEAAAWSADGTAPLYLGHPLSSTLMKGKVGLENYPEFHISYEKSTKVKTVDISAWLLDRLQQDDYVIVKMDIEGAEYSVLPKFLSTGLIDLIDELRCEFHENRFPEIKVNSDLRAALAKRTALVSWT